jgi:hypothetical protein
VRLKFRLEQRVDQILTRRRMQSAAATTKREQTLHAASRWLALAETASAHGEEMACASPPSHRAARALARARASRALMVAPACAEAVAPACAEAVAPRWAEAVAPTCAEAVAAPTCAEAAAPTCAEATARTNAEAVAEVLTEIPHAKRTSIAWLAQAERIASMEEEALDVDTCSEGDGDARTAGLRLRRLPIPM